MQYDHKKIIATAAPLAVVNLLLSMVVASVGGEEYSLYTQWVSALRLSGLAVFAFYSAWKYEITVLNVAVQFFLFLIDSYFFLYSLRSTHYVTMVFMVILLFLQLVQLHVVNSLLKAELSKIKRLPRSKIQAFGTVNSIIIGVVAFFAADHPWIYILAAHISVYELYIIVRSEREDFWYAASIVASGVVNLFAHLNTYTLEVKPIIELMDVEEHSLQNIAVYSLRTLTLVNLGIDIFLIVTVTHIIKNWMSGRRAGKAKGS